MPIKIKFFSLVIFPCIFYGCGGSNPQGLSTGPADCIGGSAADFACPHVSLRARVPLASMNGTEGNDIWGLVRHDDRQ